jgi:hypothetical protein
LSHIRKMENAFALDRIGIGIGIGILATYME